MLTTLQQDALKEFMNIYIGQSASLLSEMVNQKINLTIPKIELVSLKEETDYFQSLPSFLQGHVISSSIKFGTQFSGKARLVFPVDKTKLLVDLCLGEESLREDVPVASKLTDTDFDAIREIGNIILNAIIGGLGNLMDTKLEYSLPEIEVLYFLDTKIDLQFGKDTYILLIRNTFSFDETLIEGAVVVVLSLDSVTFLLEKINGILVKLYE